MANSIGTVAIDLEARIAKFESDLGRAARVAEKQTKQIERRAEQMRDKVSSAFKVAATAGAVVFVGLAAAINQSIDRMGDLTRAAQQVGTSTQSFTSLAYAASTVKIPMEDLRDALSGLYGQMHNALTTATGDQAIAFERLGVTLKDNHGRLKTSTEIIKDLADAYVNAGNKAQVLQLGDTVMSDDFKKLIPLLALGSAGIERLQKRAEALGVAFDTETGRKVVEFQRKIEDLKASFSGLTMQLVERLMPFLERTAGKLQEFINRLGNTHAIEKFAHGLTTIVKNLDDIAVFVGTYFVFSKIAAGVIAAAGAVDILTTSVVTLRVALTAAGGIIGIVAAGVAALAVVVYKYSQRESTANKIHEHTRSLLDKMKAAREGLTAATKDSLPGAKEAALRARDLAQSQVIAAGAMALHTQAIIDQKRAQLKEVKAAGPSGLPGTDAGYRHIVSQRSVKDQIAEQQANLDAYQAEIDSTSKAIARLSETIANAGKTIKGADPIVPPVPPSTTPSVDKLATALSAARAKVTAMARANADARDKLAGLTTAQITYRHAIQGAVADYDKLIAAGADASTASKVLHDRVMQARDAYTLSAEASEKAANSTDDFGKSQQQAAAYAEHFFRIVDQGAQSMADAFAGWMTGTLGKGRSFAGQMVDLFKNMVAQIIAQYAKLKFFGPLMHSLMGGGGQRGGMTGGMLDSLMGSGGQSGAMGWFKGIWGDIKGVFTGTGYGTMTGAIKEGFGDLVGGVASVFTGGNRASAGSFSGLGALMGGHYTGNYGGGMAFLAALGSLSGEGGNTGSSSGFGGFLQKGMSAYKAYEALGSYGLFGGAAGAGSAIASGAGLYGGLYGGSVAGASAAGSFVGGSALTGGTYVGGAGLYASSAGTGAASAAAGSSMAVPIIGWIVAAVLENFALFKQGWNANADVNADMWKDPWMDMGAKIPTLSSKLLGGLGLSDQWASILSGSSLITRIWGHQSPHELRHGIDASFGMGGAQGQAFLDWKAAGGWFHDADYGTKTQALTGDMLDSINHMWDSIKTAMTGSARALGTDMTKVLSGFSVGLKTVTDAGADEPSKYIVSYLGKTWEEATSEAAQQRIGADALLSVMQATIGAAATTMAAQWQDDAAVLADGVSTMYAAQKDIVNGTALLAVGADASVQAVMKLVEQMRSGSETLAQSYARLKQANAAYLQFVAKFQPVSDTFGSALQTIAQQMQDNIRHANALARAAGLQGAREKDLAAIHEYAAHQAADAIAKLSDAAGTLAGKLYGTTTLTLAMVNTQIDALLDKVRQAEHLALGDKSIYTDRDKLALALQGLKAGAVDAGKVLDIGHRLYGGASADYRALYNKVSGIANLPATAPDLGNSLDKLAGLTAQRDQMQAVSAAAQRVSDAQTLASYVADLATVRGQGFGEVAGSLGFSLGDLAGDLGVSDIGGYLQTQQDQDIPGALGQASTEIVTAIQGIGRDIVAAVVGGPLVRTPADAGAQIRNEPEPVRVAPVDDDARNADIVDRLDRIREDLRHDRLDRQMNWSDYRARELL